jgi:parallel beta-helix repeat protein
VSFQSYTTGSNLLGLAYRWDAQNDGVFEFTSTVSSAFAHTYTNVGLYSVRLLVTNAAGQIADFVRTNYIVVYLPHYVATNGGHVSPFITWATAATNLEAALSVAVPGGKIFVSNGNFRVPAEIVVTQPVYITSMNGATATHFVATGSSRVFRITPGVVLNGFTIRGGAATGAALNAHGGGIFFDEGGLASNCIIAANRAELFGGGAYMHYGGELRESLIQSNTAAIGGGLAAYAGGLAYNLRISTNSARDRGGGVYLFGNAVLRNSIIDRNIAASNGGGVAVQSSGPAVQNCTIVSNYAASGGGILCTDGGNMHNSISYFNFASASFPNWQTNSVRFNYGAVFSRSCLTPTNDLPSATLCFTNNPLFTFTNGIPYALDGLSPCVNMAAFSSWMIGARDLLGNPRVVGGAPDIGALERLILALAILTPSSGTRLPFSQTFITVSGTATGLVGQISYTNRFPGGAISGAIPVASNWSFNIHLPRHGEHQITVTATNLVGNVAIDTLTIRRNRNQLFIPAVQP